jgi:uncharacterized LabA/DUF88 family protein
MRPVVFIDGQNLFHLARNAWAAATGVKRYTWPSYDVQKLSQELTDKVPERTLAEIRFYTGVPDLASKPFWHGFWTKKLRVLTNQGIIVYKGRINNGQEKGVDVKLALDVVQLTHENRYDCAIVVSQDWDFGPAISLAKVIANNQSRTVFSNQHSHSTPIILRHVGFRGRGGFISTRRYMMPATTQGIIGHRDFCPSDLISTSSPSPVQVTYVHAPIGKKGESCI